MFYMMPTQKRYCQQRHQGFNLMVTKVQHIGEIQGIKAQYFNVSSANLNNQKVIDNQYDTIKKTSCNVRVDLQSARFLSTISNGFAINRHFKCLHCAMFL